MRLDQIKTETWKFHQVSLAFSSAFFLPPLLLLGFFFLSSGLLGAGLAEAFALLLFFRLVGSDSRRLTSEAAVADFNCLEAMGLGTVVGE